MDMIRFLPSGFVTLSERFDQVDRHPRVDGTGRMNDNVN